MKRTMYIAIVSIFVTLILVQSIEAQNGTRVKRQFNELKIYLTKIYVVVQRFDNQQANNLMNLAKSEMYQAEDLIFNQRKYLQAIPHMQKAKDYGNQAAKIVLSQPIGRLKQQLDDLINRSEIQLSNSQSDEARYLLNQAKKFRKLAYDAISNGRINKAQEYIRIAFYFGNKSLNMSNQNDNDLETQVAELKTNIDQLFLQVEEMVNSDAENRFLNLLNEAKRHYADATNLLDNEKTGLALKRLRLIEKLLYRIIDQMDRTSVNQKDRIENEMYSMKAFLDALESDANENKNQRIQIFLNRAKNQYREATSAFESGRYELAKNKLNLSQRFASKALQMIKVGNRYEVLDIKDRLNDNQKLLDLQKSKVDQSNNKVLKKLHQEAQNLTNRASQLYDEGEKESALQLLQLSTRLMNRIQRQVDYVQTDDTIKKNEIENKFNRAEVLLSKLKSNDRIQTQFFKELQNLENFLQQARNYYQNGEYELANEYLDYMLQQINVQSTKWSKKTE